MFNFNLQKLIFFAASMLISVCMNAQDDNSELKATYLYADSIPQIIDTIPTPENKSISKFTPKKSSEKKSKEKKHDRPFIQRVIRPEGHSPLTATTFSLILPGAGQVYNKRYWKLPIVYGGLGWMGYRIYKTTNDHRIFRKAYIKRINGESDAFPFYSESSLNTLRLATKKDQELAIIGFTAVYLLVAVDAFVDAHLWTFDVNDDLSMGINPALLSDGSRSIAPGVSLSVYLNPRNGK